MSKTTNKYAPEVRMRAVRMVLDHERDETVESATLEWVDWFNHRWLLEPIDNAMPADAKERYYTMISTFAVAA